MNIFENNVSLLKHKVLKAVIKSRQEGKLDKELLSLAEKIMPGPKGTIRCCVFKERAIVNERIKLVMGEQHNVKNNIQIIDIACDGCAEERYYVTNACRGCLANRCVSACKFGAIKIVNHRAVIDPEKCKECGACARACPYHAIAEVRRPCIKACPVGAVEVDQDTKKVSINDDKCVECGACVIKCPFGAIMERSSVLEVVDAIKESEHNKKFKNYAIIAPAISSQFTFAKIEQVVQGIKELGFHTVVEAALGADIVAYHEAKAVAEEIDELGWMTTSCCPSFVAHIRKNHPELKEHISKAVSPMVATARLIRETDSTARITFIGPCISKKSEADMDGVSEAINYVITFQELQAMFDANDMVLEELEESALDNASYYGRIFARSGGVSEAVEHVIKEYGIEKEIKTVKGNGLKECEKLLKLAKLGRLDGSLIEGMACEGGCISGPGSISRRVRDRSEVDNYAKLSAEKTVKESLKVLDIEKLSLDI